MIDRDDSPAPAASELQPHDADPDIPILIEAKKEYDHLQAH
jgi:hypothetical protein